MTMTMVVFWHYLWSRSTWRMEWMKLERRGETWFFYLSIKSYPIRLIFNGEKYSFHHFGWWKYRWNHQDHAFYKLASRPRQKPAENSTLSAAQVRHLMDFLLKYGSFLDIFRLNLSESKHGWETHESVSQVSKKQAYGLLLFFLILKG